MGGEIPPLDWVNTSMDTEVEIKQTDKLDISKPKKYSVILFNDNSTPMEFVIDLLKSVFNHTQENANLSTPPRNEHKLPESSVGSISIRRSERYTDVHRCAASLSIALFGRRK